MTATYLPTRAARALNTPSLRIIPVAEKRLVFRKLSFRALYNFEIHENMTIFSSHNLSKTYNDVELFRQIAFGMEEGERVGIIGRNGVGKSTLMRIIAGIEQPDEGTVAFNNQMRFEYLHQLPVFHGGATVLSTVIDAKPHIHQLIEEHGKLCAALTTEQSETVKKRLEQVSHAIDMENGWNIETEARIILNKLGMTHFDADVSKLSGGQRKRVALARVLLADPNLLILDEPTNHLDADSVQWLQDRLQYSTKALLLVTHDRYFLDAVCTRIVELDQSKLLSYPGSYEKYLEIKEAAVTAQEAEAEHTRNKLRTELAWLQKGAKARRTKQKSRIDWIAKMQSEQKKTDQRDIKIEVGTSFLGGRVIDATNLGKSVAGNLLFKDFTYVAAPGDRIGIIGPNGSGKSTLLRILSGEIEPDAGYVNTGSTVRIGFFRQENSAIDPSQTVIGSLREIAEFIDTGVGRDRYISARELLDRFLFPPKQQHSQIQTLSGGERRRLELLRVLMGNPNVLFLDEPTNDFDIATLSTLEEYLQHFLGCLIIVSHDRAFLDRTVNTIYAFEEGGKIKEYPGNYSAYLEKKEQADSLRSQNAAAARKEEEKKEQAEPKKDTKKKKLSYNDQRIYDALEKKIAELESEKETLNAFLASGGNGDYREMAEKGERLAKLEEELDEAMMRWLEMSEMIE